MITSINEYRKVFEQIKENDQYRYWNTLSKYIEKYNFNSDPGSYGSNGFNVMIADIKIPKLELEGMIQIFDGIEDDYDVYNDEKLINPTTKDFVERTKLLIDMHDDLLMELTDLLMELTGLENIITFFEKGIGLFLNSETLEEAEDVLKFYNFEDLNDWS